MKIFDIISVINGKRLAEVRTDGRNCQVVMDLSNGKIRSMFSSDFETGSQKIKTSGYLDIIPSQGGVGLYRYLLQNGDMITISSDGLSISLNGSLLDQRYRQGLLEALSSGKIKVKNKSGFVDPSVFYQAKPVNIKAQEDEKAYGAAIRRHADRVKDKKLPKYSRKYDPTISAMMKSEIDDKSFKTSLAFLLRHGDR